MPTPNLSLPYIAASQAQKHVTHNEALDLLDVLVQLTAESASQTAPPTGAAVGTRYIVPAGATGDWAGQAGKIAQQDAGGWRFAPPTNGLRAWVRDSASLLIFDSGVWSDLRALLGALSLSQLGVNATADATNRLAVASASSLFTHLGGNHRLAINKQAAANTASLVFQSGFSGRAEFGLPGSDDFSVKVSSNGSAWNDAIQCAAATGLTRLPNGISAPGLPLRIVTSVLATAFTTTLATPQATGLQITITPRAASSKLLVRCHLTLGANFFNAAPAITVNRNGAKIWPSSAGVSMTHQVLSNTLTNSRLHTLPATFEFLDEPASAAAVTYQVMLATTVAGNNAHLNVRDSDLALRGESSIVVTEISG
ncbi:DUF2793 domain-containing protein [Escherichia coli]|nr:DUF2793 domain-containing protein [Escherichia coli]